MVEGLGFGRVVVLGSYLRGVYRIYGYVCGVMRMAQGLPGKFGKD